LPQTHESRRFTHGHRKLTIKEEDRPQCTPMGVVQLLARTASAGRTHRPVLQTDALPARRTRCTAHARHLVIRQKSMASPALTMHARRRSKWKRLISASCAAIWNATPSRPSALRQVDPLMVSGLPVRACFASIRQLNLYRDLIEERTKDKPNS